MFHFVYVSVNFASFRAVVFSTCRKIKLSTSLMEICIWQKFICLFINDILNYMLWLLLTRFRIPDKIVSLITGRALYSNSVSCVCASQSETGWLFMIESGDRQGCVLAPDSFATGMDWFLERTVGICINGVLFGLH